MLLLSLGEGCTHGIVCWDINQSAAAYSTLASVLAGFLVSAIIFSLSDRKEDRKSKETSLPLYSSSVTCLSFALASFLFAMLVGTETTTPASTSLAYILGSVAFGIFAMSVIQLMLSIIWYFDVHEIDSSVISRMRFLFQAVLVAGMLYMFKFSVDVLRIKSGDAQEHPWIILISVIYLAYACIAMLAGASYMKKRRRASHTTGMACRVLNGVVGWLDSNFATPAMSLKLLSTCTGLFVILVAIIYGFIALNFINWVSVFNSLSYYFYLYATIFIFTLSPLFFIFAQLSLPEVKQTEEIWDVSSKHDHPATIVINGNSENDH